MISPGPSRRAGRAQRFICNSLLMPLFARCRAGRKARLPPSPALCQGRGAPAVADCFPAETGKQYQRKRKKRQEPFVFRLSCKEYPFSRLRGRWQKIPWGFEPGAAAEEQKEGPSFNAPHPAVVCEGEIIFPRVPAVGHEHPGFTVLRPCVQNGRGVALLRRRNRRAFAPRGSLRTCSARAWQSGKNRI